MNWMLPFDPYSGAFVLIGTLAATWLRCGARNCGEALRAIGTLLARPFDAEGTRAELAVQIQEIRERGLLGAEPRHLVDGEFDDLSDRLIKHRSVATLHEEHERHRSRRMASAEAAREVLLQAAELSPVLGLAGTLLALGATGTQAATGNYAAAIGIAVGTTFFGLICAHFLFVPLASRIARRAAAEEAARQELLDWLVEGAETASQPRRAAKLVKKVAA